MTDLDAIRRNRSAAQKPSAAPKAKASAKKNRRFNQEKVDRLKAEIASGDYEVDAERVAYKFIEHERH